MIWPANALTLGLLLRIPDRRIAVCIAAPIAFMAADFVAGTSLTESLLLNCANLFGVAAAYSAYRFLPTNALSLDKPESVFYIIFLSAIGATFAGLIGALADPFLLKMGYFSAWSFWFSTEIVNYIALLPLILSAPSLRLPRLFKRRRNLRAWRNAAPVGALVLSCAAAMAVGGPGAIAFAVPALLWCGIAYSVFSVSALAFLFACWSLTHISSQYLLDVAGAYDGRAIMSVRLAIFMIALAPVTLSIVMRNREKLAVKLATERRRVDMALEAGGIVGTWDLEVATDTIMIEATDPRSRAVLYRTAQQVGDVLVNMVHPEDRKHLRNTLNAAIATGTDFRCKYRTAAYGNDDVRFLVAFGKPVLDGNNLVSHLVGILIDLTEQERTAETLDLSDKRFNIVSESIPDIVWSTDGSGRHDYFNCRWSEFTGIAPEDITPEIWRDLVHPEDSARVYATWAASLATGAGYAIDYRFRYRDGTYRWLRVQAKPLRDAQGAIVRWYGTSTDIDDAKKLEAEREAVACELDHRIGNLFALVQGMINLSVRENEDVSCLAESIRGRLRALHDAHSLIRSRATPNAASIHDLLQKLFLPYEDGSGRISISGDDFQLDSSTATPMALIFHELATNAVKYGALGSADGTLRVAIRHADGRLKISWIEDGRAASSVCQGSGFGSKLFCTIVEGQLHGTATKSFGPNGLIIAISVPVDSFARCS